MGDTIINYFSTGTKKEIPCTVTLNSQASSINFECNKFSFSIILNDIVDIEELYNILNKKSRKIILQCNLKKQDKHYKGPRKLILKNDNIAVSQGGIRLEFDNKVQEQLLEVVNVIKNR